MTIRTAGPGRVASQADVGALTRYRRACDYLAAAMIYLRDNVLLTEPLRPEHLKPRLLGHWGTCPGITFVYAGVTLLTSEGCRQEHNGYSHQGPGFINNLLTKKASVSRIYLAPDANTLLVTMERCLATTGHINLVVGGKQPMPQWLDLEAARAHCRAGAGVWPWACSNGAAEASGDPDVVLACAGTVPTVETLAAAALLRREAPELRVRVVNVVDLLTLAPRDRHPHGMTETWS